MDGLSGRRAPVGAVAHPATGALAEIVVDADVLTGSGQQRDRLHRGHEARLVEADAYRITGAECEERLLLLHVPVAVSGAHAIRHRQPDRDRLLTELVVDVLGQALDRAGAN